MDYDCNGERSLCPDLINFEVQEVRTTSQQQLWAQCGRFTHGCAQLNFTTGECVIYMPRNASRETRMHERNHCRGWTHPADNHREWYPMEAPHGATYNVASPVQVRSR